MTLSAPYFPRLDEWAGLWLMEESAFAAHWRLLERTDFAAHMAAGPPPKPQTGYEVQQVAGRNIGIVKAVGTLMKQQSSMGGTSTIALRRQVREAAADPNVGAVLLAIDSPGGTAAGTAELAADVKAARRKKPVWAHIDDLGASAAYWVASQADAVFANQPSAWVGSIGTMMTVFDTSAMAEKEGVKPIVFKTGPLKAAGAFGTVVTEEQQAYFQRLVNATQEQFDAAVMSGRGLSAAKLAAVRTGGVFPASEAADLKLIDGVRPLEQTLNALAKA